MLRQVILNIFIWMTHYSVIEPVIIHVEMKKHFYDILKLSFQNY